MQGGGVRVLIAEDDEAVRELIRINIELAGHEIAGEATNGREALDLLQAERPDVLILDMMMPNMNGREVLEELNKAEYDGTLVLAFSAAPNELEHAIQLGADAAVLKTGDFDVLVDALATL
jgi:DNA-binding NarL/FixJ family response regulator